MKIHYSSALMAVLAPLAFPTSLAAQPLDLQIEPVSSDPLQLEETTIQITLKNVSEEPVRLLDRFSDDDRNEAFLITIKDSEGKFVASSPFRKFLYPRPVKFKTLKQGAKISVPVNLGTFLFEQRPPLRHLLPVIAEDETYYVTVTYTNSCEKTNDTKLFCESKPMPVQFKKRPTPEYKIFGSVELSSPCDLSKPFPVDRPCDGLLVTVAPPAGEISREQDAVTITFDNKWEVPVNLWKLQPEAQAAANACTLSFILCREDGTTVVNARKLATMAYDPQFKAPLEAGGQKSMTVALKQFLPAYIFDRDGEYRLIAKYENSIGGDCLQGAWYSQPINIRIRKP